MVHSILDLLSYEGIWLGVKTHLTQLVRIQILARKSPALMSAAAPLDNLKANKSLFGALARGQAVALCRGASCQLE